MAHYYFAPNTGDGKTITKDETSVFDDDNRLMRDTQVLAPTGQTSHTVTVTYDYRLADGHGNYTGADQGVVTHTQQRDTASPSVIDTATSYVWWDQAEQSRIQVRGSDPGNPNISILGSRVAPMARSLFGAIPAILVCAYQGPRFRRTRKF